MSSLKKRNLAIVILAAGKGTRMKSSLPKVMHMLAGRPLMNWVLETAQGLKPSRIVVVVGPGMKDVEAAVAPHECVIQSDPKGTAHAVKAALPALKGHKGDVLVMYGDGPLYRPQTLKALLTKLQKDSKADMAWLAMRPDDPSGYGRMILNRAGFLERIVEEKDADAAQKKINLCWTGVMCGRMEAFTKLLPRVGNKNAKKEYYLTDLVALSASGGGRTVVAESPMEETLGANNRVELSVLEQKIQQRLREEMMLSGVTLIDPDSVFFSYDTIIGEDCVVEPGVFFGPGVKAGKNVHIKAFCHLEGAIIGDGVSVGPFARIRPHSVIGDGSRIGNFVEIKNSRLDEGVKAGHLGYIGDAEVGAHTNFSCGAITVNYDGRNKHKTKIGAHAMVGSNVNLIAPVTVGDEAYIAAGSTIIEDVPGGTLAIARSRQEN